MAPTSQAYYEHNMVIFIDSNYLAKLGKYPGYIPTYSKYPGSFLI